MLSVLPIQEKNEQRTACLLCGSEFDADLLAYKILDEDRLVGVCQFKMTPDGGSIVTLNGLTGEEHFEYLFMLGRGTLNFMDNCGARFAFLDDPSVDATTAKAIGFSPDESGRLKIDLKLFFESPCQHE